MLLDDVATRLEASGLGLTIGTNLFKSIVPDSPDVASSIFEYGGTGPIKTMANAPGQAVAEQPSFQIQCRGARENVTSSAYSTARILANNIMKSLDGYTGTINATKYFWIEAISSPYFLKRDENGRPYIAIDFDCQKALS